MNAEVKLFANGIKEKTGINFSVYDQNKILVFGENLALGELPTDFDGIIIDTEKNLTFFNLKFKNKKYVCVLLGSTEAQKNYAFLIGELAENSFSKDSEITRSEFLKSVLLGEMSYSRTIRYMKKYGFKDKPAFVMLAFCDNGLSNELVSVLNVYMDEKSGVVVSVDESQLAIIKFVDAESEAYSSSTEYAEFLIRLVHEEAGVRLKILIGGTVNTLVNLNQSYQQAITAGRISSSFGDKGSVHSFSQYVLIRMLEDMPKYKLKEYTDLLLETNAKEIFEDEEMTSTAEEFLENSLNVSETSRKLYLHRNTLAYRLDKIQRLTGLNIRKFSDAVTFRLITILSKLGN